ncbi:hypothetical protein [Gulosibacter molinativorax]|uniref:Integral membrane protein n=1 Tax=Gulosibacter molinativorax TaxID=256821 RepID=A0ABT7CC60_9MICO|nr:hypothetical protein [Gulosibacter molinativorax]MDJ1372342.1 hypothetical protein [Gulosibacter molinativorax]QUY63568.1 Hypotetical protein [Gulosibacter molinativorax]
MEILKDILLILHIIGIAGLFGGWFMQVSKISKGTAVIPAGMVHSGWLMLISGILMFGVNEAIGGVTMDIRIKILVKLIIAIVVMVLVFMNRKKESVNSGVMWAIGGLTLANIVIAVLWK